MSNKRLTAGRRCAPWIAAACAIVAFSASAGERLQMQLHWREIPGVRQIENGHYEKGVQRLEKRRAMATRPATLAPILIDLCVGYTMLNQLDKAAEACDAAIATRWYTTLAFNNRGVLNTVRGHYAAAFEDFRAARRAPTQNQVARANTNVAEQQMAIAGQPPVAFAGNVSLNDTSVITLHDAGQ